MTALAVAFLLFGGVAVVIQSGSDRIALASATDCQVSDDDALNAASAPTQEGHYPHEEWIANDNAQTIVRALGASLEGSFGVPSKAGDFPELAAGFVGVALDHHAKEYVVIVDASVDRPNLQRKLENVARANAPAGTRPFSIRVAASCFPAADLLEPGS